MSKLEAAFKKKFLLFCYFFAFADEEFSRVSIFLFRLRFWVADLMGDVFY